METVQEDDFPCLDCPQRFSEYHKYKLHARKQLEYTVLYKKRTTMELTRDRLIGVSLIKTVDKRISSKIQFQMSIL